MAISPIAIATHGTLNSPLSIAAVRGHLTIDGIIPTPFTPEPVYPPGMGPEARLRHKRILQEDEIIMSLIVAFLDMKDK